MMGGEKKKAAKWWQFVLSILAFVILYFFSPAILNLLWRIMDLFSPKAFKSTAEWINIVTVFMGHVFALAMADAIVESKHPVFSMVIAIVAALYTVGVSVWNYSVGVIDFLQVVAMWAGAIASIVMAVMFAQNIGKKREIGIQSGSGSEL